MSLVASLAAQVTLVNWLATKISPPLGLNTVTEGGVVSEVVVGVR